MKQFTLATRVVASLGSAGLLSEELVRHSAPRALIIADRGVHDAGLLADILRPVPESMIAGTGLVDPDPDIDAIERLVGQARPLGTDVIVAIGGGSALGAAKAVGIRLTNRGRIDDYLGVDQVPNAPLPTIAIPTTAGSGSEVSTVLVLHEQGRVEELVIRSSLLAPRVAILDGTVLRRLPWRPLVFAALDALSHCLESTWSRHRSLFTLALAEKAAQTLISTLPIAVDGIANGDNRAGRNDDALQLLIEASSAANMACGNSGLALVHALSTAPSVHLPHGQQNGVLLLPVASFNDSISSPTTRELVGQVASLYDRIGFEAAFPKGAVGPNELAAMVAASTGHPFRSNNARPSNDDDLISILTAVGGEAR